jgi:hypothetical protein
MTKCSNLAPWTSLFFSRIQIRISSQINDARSSSLFVKDSKAVSYVDQLETENIF